MLMKQIGLWECNLNHFSTIGVVEVNVFKYGKASLFITSLLQMFV